MKNKKNENKKDITDFSLSHGQVYDKIYTALKENYDTEDSYYGIVDVYDDYCIIVDYYADYTFYKVGYTKTENDTIAIEGKDNAVQVYSEFLTKEERDAINNKQLEYSKMEEDYEKVKADYSKLEEDSKELKTNYDALVEEKETITLDFETKKTEFEEQKTTLELDKEVLEKENAELSNFKLTTLRTEKKNIINEYSTVLDSEIIEKYSLEETLDNISAIDLEKELSYELVKNKKEAIFKHEDANSTFSLFPKEIIENTSKTEDRLIETIQKNIKSN